MKKILYSIAFIFLLFLQLQLAAQPGSGSIEGIVLTSDNQPAVAVTVSLKGSTKATITDDAGHFSINKIEPGNYQLIVSLIGNNTRSHPVTVQANNTLHVELQLQASSGVLQDVTVTTAATRFAKKQSDYVARMPLKNLENAQVYTVVPKELFREQVSTDLRSALQTVSGLANVTQTVGSGGIGLSIRLRGFTAANNAVGAIRNGMSTNWVSLSDPVNLESIEIIKGPSATLFGGSLTSYGGLINRVTKRPFDVAKGEIGYSTGSFGLNRLTADINTPLNADKSLMLRVNAAFQREKTFQDYGRANTEVFAPALTYRVNDKLTLDFDFEFYHTKRNTTYTGSVITNGAVKASGLDALKLDFKQSYTTNDLMSDAKVFNAYAKINYKISNQWTSQTLYSYANTENSANYLFLVLNTDSTFLRRLLNIPSTFGMNQVQQNFIGDFKIGGLRNRFLGGLDYTALTSLDRRTAQLLYDTVNFKRPAKDISNEKYLQMQAASARSIVSRDFQTYSSYVSDVLNITDQLIVSGSVRYNHYKSKIDNFSQNTVSQKAGIIYQIVKNRISLFGNYMTGFSNIAPGYIYAVSQSEKTAFKPERATQLEGGIKVEVLKGKLNGTLSYYHINVKDKIRTDPVYGMAGAALNYQLQDGTQLSKGFEADLIASPFTGMHIIAGYGYNDSKLIKADSSVVNLRPISAPFHTANFWISYTVMNGKAKGLGIGLGGNYQSEAYLVNNRVKQGAYYKKDPFTFTVPSYTRFDATLLYDQPKYRFGVKVNNLTDKEYWTSDVYTFREHTRQFIANVMLKF